MKITVRININAPMAKVWEAWTTVEHIKGWAFASEDWQADAEKNDLTVGGRFKIKMSARDNSASFDFTGTYTAIEEYRNIEYQMDDGRQVSTLFEETPEGVLIIQAFDAETENTEEMQRAGWQGFLNNFKKYTELLK